MFGKYVGRRAIVLLLPMVLLLQQSDNVFASMQLKGSRSRHMLEKGKVKQEDIIKKIDEDKTKQKKTVNREVDKKAKGIAEDKKNEAKAPSLFAPSFPAPASAPAIDPDSNTAAAVVGPGVAKNKNKASKEKDGVLPFKKIKKAKKFKDQTDDTIFGKKIKKGLTSKKSKIKKAKSKKKSKKSKWPGGEISYIVPWRFTDPKTGAAVDKTRSIRCPVNNTELFLVADIPRDEFGHPINPDDDPFAHDVLCHNAAMGLNFTTQIEHIFFHELAPSTVPSISHAPSTSMSPSLSPSISFAPSSSHAPTIVHKGMNCRERPTSEPTVANSTLSNFTRRLNATSNTNTNSSSTNMTLETDAVDEIPEKDILAILGGWNRDGPNEKPKFWYELPYCDSVPSVSPAPSQSLVPSSPPTISLLPSSSLMPTLSDIPSLAPSRDGYKGPLVGMGCQLAADGIMVVGVGDDVEVEFLYEVVTNVVNITSSNVLKYIEEQMHGIVTPALLECETGNTTRRLQTSSGVQYLVPDPEDILTVDDFCKSGMPVGPDESCYRVKARMTAIVEEGFPFIADSINIEVMGAARDGLNDGSYISADEGVIDTRFIGIDESQVLIETPAGASQSVQPVERKPLTQMGTAFIALAVVGFIVVLLLAIRKRKSTEVIIMEELEDDDEFYKDDDFKDTRTVRTSMSSPMSNISHDLDASPRNFVNVLGGNNQDSSIVDELRNSENYDRQGQNALHIPYQATGLNRQNTTRDVHKCTSATCEICKPWKNHDPTFISASSQCPIASPEAKAPRSDYKLERKRAYKTDDTVLL